MKLKKNWLSIALISLCCALAVPAWAAPQSAPAKTSKAVKAAKAGKTAKATPTAKSAKSNKAPKLAQGKSRSKAVAKVAQRGKQVARAKVAPRARQLAARKPARLAARRDASAGVLAASALNPGYVATAARPPQVATAAASGATGASFGQIYGLHHTQDPLELKSSVALVVDQDTNEVLFAKNSGAVLPIASLTKLMTAMVMVESHLPLDDMITITNDDVDTEKNSSSRLMVGATLSRGELLHLSLMASENRAAHALGRSFPGGLQAFVHQMNAKARQLGMADTRYVDPTGLNSGNQASAKDLATLAKAAYQQPLIRELSISPEYAVRVGNRQLQFRNTNSLVRNPSWEIGLQKTGYIVEAGRCLVMQARMAGRKLIMVFLDSSGKYSRQADAERVRRWIEISTQKGAVSAVPQRKLTS
jgi:serine-type D-Ala-D-Ala endopeptidase (penicillin-binding protein 7)